MPKIIIDGREIEAREGIPVLRAALEAGLEIPHYCYHPGLSVVASCRLCLMEMKLPHPQTREPVWAPKLFPSCQTPVKDGMEVRFDSEAVRSNVRHCMEYYLLNHPLDCPVCDKAGECWLQDYTEEFGPASSRMIEDKLKNPKKDIGPHTLLYQDRCVLCSRCVRFCQEVAGTGELAIVDRGNRCEIDVFPGVPLENRLQGNVVDLCPVGALLDKDFLFKQRVWMLRSTRSVCPGCSRGCTILVDHDGQRVHRLRPRFNEKVNQWWMCDEGRFGWKYVHSDRRLTTPRLRGDGQWQPLSWEELPGLVRERLRGAAAEQQGARVAVVLSPMMSCEEAWLLARFARSIAPQAVLVRGPVPVLGSDVVFPKGFIICAEKVPNRRGVERIIQAMEGPCADYAEFLRRAAGGDWQAAYVMGGYPGEWVDAAAAQACARIPTLIVHDLLASRLDESATIQIPSASWAEREGCFINCDGLVQPFERALRPLEGVKPDGQFLAELAGEPGLFRARRVREQMARQMPEFASPHVPREEPKHAH